MAGDGRCRNGVDGWRREMQKWGRWLETGGAEGYLGVQRHPAAAGRGKESTYKISPQADKAARTLCCRDKPGHCSVETKPGYCAVETKPGYCAVETKPGHFAVHRAVGTSRPGHCAVHRSVRTSRPGHCCTHCGRDKPARTLQCTVR